MKSGRAEGRLAPSVKKSLTIVLLVLVNSTAAANGGFVAWPCWGCLAVRNGKHCQGVDRVVEPAGLEDAVLVEVVVGAEHARADRAHD